MYQLIGDTQMKQLIIIALVIGTIITKASAADCNITLKAKKLDSVSGKLGDVSFSKKHIKALKKSGCTVSVELMSRDELVLEATKSIDKRIAKAAAAKLEDQAE